MKKAILFLFIFSVTAYSAEGERILTINSIGHKSAIRKLLVDQNENIITAGYDKVIKIWNSEEGFLEREIYGQIGPGSEGMIYDIALSTDDKYLAVGGWMGDNNGTEAVGDIRVFNYKTGKQTKLLKKHFSPVNQLEFFNAQILVSLDGEGNIVLWDVTTGEHYFYEEIPQDVIKMTTFGSYLVTGHVDGMIRLWDLNDPKKPYKEYNGIAKLESPSIHAIGASPNLDYIAVGSGGNVYILNEKLKEIYSFWNGDDEITQVVFSPNSSKLLVATSSYYIKKNKMKAYYIIDDKFYSMTSYTKHTDLVLGAGWVDDKTCVTAGGRDNEIAIWRPSDRKRHSEEVLVIKGAASPLYAVSMNGNEVGYTTHWSKNFGFSKLTQIFNMEARRIYKMDDSSKFSQPIIEKGEYSLESKRQGINREVLNLKKGKSTVAKINRDEFNGTLHNVYSFVGEDHFVSGGGYGFLQAFNYQGELVSNLVGHEGDIWGISVSADGKYLISCSNDQTIKIWDIAEIGSAESIFPVVSIFVTNDFEWVIWNPDGYFTSSKKGAGYVGYHVNQGRESEAKFYPFEQFDLKYNRPDIIMSELGIVDQAIIELYKRAYDKRIKRMGISEEDLAEDLNVPIVKVKSKKKVDGQLEMELEASDEKVNLNRLNVFINDVPVFGRKGIDLKPENSKKIQKSVTVDLMGGRNKIQISVLNNNGTESLKETFWIGGGEETKPDLYIMSVGVSNYLDSTFNLDYAAKDADDINDLFTGSELYENVNSKVLTNAEVTKKGILEAQEFFSKAKANDVVIIFIAGHGVLDKDLDYYYCTYDVDFQNPSKNGISYEKLESLFDGIAALKKLLIMDTCHSGEVDKEDIDEIASVNTELGEITFRTTDATTTYTERSGLKQINESVKEMFNDLRRGTGATVLSSAGGVEFAMESENWKNGLFTYCLLNGLKSGEADLNEDGEIYLSELQLYVRDKVVKLSKGKQQPTSRLENISLDYRIW